MSGHYRQRRFPASQSRHGEPIEGIGLVQRDGRRPRPPRHRAPRVERRGLRLRHGDGRLELHRHRSCSSRLPSPSRRRSRGIRSAGCCWVWPSGWCSTVSAAPTPRTRWQQDADLPGIRLAAAWASAWWPLWFGILGAILFLLPDGRLPSRRWRPVAGAGIAAVVLALSGGFLGHEQRVVLLEDIEPFGILPASIAETMLAVGLVGMTVVLVLIVAAMVIRFRHATTEVRAQLKWIALAAALFPVALAAWAIESAVGPSGSPAVVTQVVLGLAIAGFCCAIAIAVLRYRLYDIDLVINRAVVYGTLTLVVVAGYVGWWPGSTCSSDRGAGPASSPPGRSRLPSSRSASGSSVASTGGSTATGPTPTRRCTCWVTACRPRWLRTRSCRPSSSSVAEALRVPYVAVTFARGGRSGDRGRPRDAGPYDAGAPAAALPGCGRRGAGGRCPRRPRPHRRRPAPPRRPCGPGRRRGARRTTDRRPPALAGAAGHCSRGGAPSGPA